MMEQVRAVIVALVRAKWRQAHDAAKVIRWPACAAVPCDNGEALLSGCIKFRRKLRLIDVSGRFGE